MLFVCVILLFLHIHKVELATNQWEPLQIGVLYNPRYFHFPKHNLAEFKDALLNLNSMIQVRPLPEEERQMIGHKYLAKCAPAVDFKQLQMLSVSSDGHQIEHWSYPILNDSSVANFFIIVDLVGNECLNDPSLLAGAKPCFYDIKTNNRPSISRIAICFNNLIWREFQAGFDLFRHEILHALGFGMLHPQTEIKKAPKPEIVSWRTGPSTQQLIRNSYLDFSEKAINFARSYFNCQQMDAILADNEETFHLNEYLFGNELMTPILSNGRNYFTHLTGSILESTHFGNLSWYSVNKELVEQESQEYWYGRDAGCNFVEQSCYEFIKNRSNLFEGAAFPFCTESELKKTINDRDLNICFSNKTHTIKLKATCQIEYDIEEFDQEAEYELKPVPLNNQFKSLFRRHKVYGSMSSFRFCPLISHLFDGPFDKIPLNGLPTKCPN